MHAPAGFNVELMFKLASCRSLRIDLTTQSLLLFLCITVVLPVLFWSLWGTVGEKSEVLLAQEVVIFRNTFSVRSYF